MAGQSQYFSKIRLYAPHIFANGMSSFSVLWNSGGPYLILANDHCSTCCDLCLKIADSQNLSPTLIRMWVQISKAFNGNILAIIVLRSLLHQTTKSHWGPMDESSSDRCASIGLQTPSKRCSCCWLTHKNLVDSRNRSCKPIKDSWETHTLGSIMCRKSTWSVGKL